MTRRSLLVAVVVMTALVFAAGRRSAGSVSGGVSPSIAYDGDVRGPDGREQYRFTIEVERVMFRLLAVQNRYSLVRLRMQNSTSAPLALSADKDRLELVVKGSTPVQAVLNLQRGDSAWWDSLDPGMRETLAYPVTLKGVPAPAGGEPQRSPESLYFYAFFPSSAARAIPTGFAYTIASLGQTIRIEHRAAAAAN